jgi:pimeloyl-ACP methyl ester carboxylesterase
VAASRVEGPQLVNGIELSWLERGAGPPLLCLHETAAVAAVWDPLLEAVGADARVIAPDRRGWGDSGAPEMYAATTVEEQAADAASLLELLGAAPALICGSGLGAVVALELLLRRRELTGGALLIEPPLLAYVPEATEGLSADRQAITDAVRDGGPEAAMELYLAGGLAYLGPGAERIPDAVGAAARGRPLSLFAELGAVPAWSLRTGEMLAMNVPSRIVCSSSTPPVLRAAADQLAVRLGRSEPLEIGAEGLPHVGGAGQLADAVRDLLESGRVTPA